MSHSYWTQGQHDAYYGRGRNAPRSRQEYDQYNRGFAAGQEQLQRYQEAQQALVQTEQEYQKAFQQSQQDTYQAAMAEIERLHGSGS